MRRIRYATTKGSPLAGLTPSEDNKIIQCRVRVHFTPNHPFFNPASAGSLPSQMRRTAV